MDLRTYIRDPAAFQRDLHVPTAAGSRRFGDVMAAFQAERFAAMNPSLVAVAAGAEPPRRRFWIEATKGASKDSDLAICLLWLLAFAPRSLRIQIGAYDQDQADEIRLIVRQLLRIDAPLNRAIASLVEVRADAIENTRTGSRAEILTTDSKGSHGSRPDVVLLNELSHVGDKEFAETLLDNADKMPRSVVIIATNAGWTDCWQAEWKAAAVASERWYVHEFQRPAPWIDPADLAESERRNPPARYRRLWWGVWVAGKGDALPEDAITAALNLEKAVESVADLGPGWAITSRKAFQRYCGKSCSQYARNRAQIDRKRKTDAEPRISPRLIAARAAAIRAMWDEQARFQRRASVPHAIGDPENDG